MALIHRAGIVGLNWGLVHLRGLREAGCQVELVAAQDRGRAREVAAREGVPAGTSDIAELNELDVVVIATPAASHAEVIRQLPGPFLICEKPLLGITGRPSDLAGSDQRLLVNYAFSFLHTARQLGRLMAERGAPAAARVRVSANLPLDLTPTQWFLEAASHPVSWLLHELGQPTRESFTEEGSEARSRFTAGGVPVGVEVGVGGAPGIHQEIELAWPDAVARVAGRYVPGQPWVYDPITVNSRQISPGESSPTDPWMDANAASVQGMIAAFRGEVEWGDALNGGLFDAAKALWVESLLPGWPAS